MQTDLFSFVLPVYKGLFLKEAIQSILNQSYQNFELIIVNDCSPDNITEIVGTFNDSRIRYYENPENIGGKDLVKQWNHSLSFAQGKFILMAGDDDVYSPNFLTEAYTLFQKYPQADILRGRVQEINFLNQIINIDFQSAEYISFWDFLLLEKHIIPCIGNYIFKRKKLIQTGFISFPLAWWSDRATAILYAFNGMLITKNIAYSFRKSNIHISAKKDKYSIYKKIKATSEYFYWLKKTITPQYFKDKDMGIAQITYHKQFESNHLYFHSISKLILSLNIYDFFVVLNKIKQEKLITVREYFKLIYFFITRVSNF